MPDHPATTLLVLAKEPVAGRVKTRLHAAYSPAEAAELAAAALHDTLAAVAACSADRRVVALDGQPGPWLPPGFAVVPQVEGSFATRLDGAWAAVTGPCLQIGMDTPQVSAALLDASLATLLQPGTAAALGLAEDGGWWALGLRTPQRGAFDDVPMSRDDTGARQLERLHALGLRTSMLPTLRDLDRPDDVTAIARAHPDLRVSALARRLGSLTPR